MKRFLVALSALLCFSFIAAAADVTGKWTADIPGRNGNTQTTTITLKADGAKLDGSVSNPRGDSPIADGKVDGDNISFTVTRQTQNGDQKIMYKGVVKGDTIDFSTEGGRGPQTFTAKKAK